MPNKQSLLSKLINLAVILLGIALGLVLGYLVLRSSIPWLVVSVALLAALIARWQTPCIQIELGDSKPFQNTQKNKQKRFPCFKRWLWRLSAYLLLVIIVAVLESWWWVKQPVIMNVYGKQQQTYLPTSYAFKRILWQLGLNKPSPELVEITAGNFEMGSREGEDDEKPVHKVTIKQNFQMSKNEITFEQYDYYIWSMQKELADISPRQKTIHYSFDNELGRENRPVIYVNWQQAQNYANWWGKQINQYCRLPSEAEWEYAARAGTTTRYSWGDNIGKNKANCRDCGSKWDNKKTAPVGSFSANQFSLNDMHGNAYEWTQDCYKDSYSGVATDGSAHEEAKCKSRVLRGGSWNYTSNFLRSANRSRSFPGDRNDNIGFRIICAPPIH